MSAQSGAQISFSPMCGPALGPQQAPLQPPNTPLPTSTAVRSVPAVGIQQFGANVVVPPHPQSVKRSHHAAVPSQQQQVVHVAHATNQMVRGVPSSAQPAKRRRRAGDQILPPEVGDLFQYQAYMNSLAFERKLDALITRKRLEIQETLKKSLKVKRKLRIYFSHTFYPGKTPQKEGDEGAVAQWELRIEGRLMEEDLVKQGQPMPKRKFSSFFKSLVIELDREVYGPDNHLVEWHRTASTNETDGFQVKRPGERSVKCTILLLLDYMPMKFKLDPRLARLLGIYTETRQKIIEALWEYIKKHKLQDAHERDHINCDKYLEQTFQCQRMRFIDIPQRLNALLMPPDPIIIHHVITCSPDGTEPKKTVCYDIDVEVEDPIKSDLTQFLRNVQNQNDIATCDNKIYETVELIQQFKIQREFFLGFSQTPKEFIEKWILSQSRDLKLMTEMADQPEEERKSTHYESSWIDEAVGRYFYGKVMQKRAELELALGVRNAY